jgi:hypothetical protein
MAGRQYDLTRALKEWRKEEEAKVARAARKARDDLMVSIISKLRPRSDDPIFTKLRKLSTDDLKEVNREL